MIGFSELKLLSYCLIWTVFKTKQESVCSHRLLDPLPAPT